MIPFALPLCVLFAPTQDDPPPPLPPTPEVSLAEALSDWIMGVAGNEAVLRSDLEFVIMGDRDLQERWAKARDARERMSVYNDALETHLEDLLKIQAGKDLGFDPELVELFTEGSFERDIERMGGYLEARDTLRNMQITPEIRREYLRDGILRQSWEDAIRGRFPGPTGRRAVDRYIRPGWLASSYRTFTQSPLDYERALVGMYAERVRLQHLIIDAKTWGGQEEALPIATELRRRCVEEGEPFLNLVRGQYSADPRDDGMWRPREGAAWERVGRELHRSEVLGQFANAGQPGDVTEPLPLFRNGEPAGWSVWHLVERQPASQAAAFTDKGVQDGLRRHLEASLDEVRMERAFRRVLEASYVHPENLRTFLEARKKLPR